MKKLLLLVFLIVAILISCESEHERILASDHIEVRSEVGAWLEWEVICPDGNVVTQDAPFIPENFVMRAELGKEYIMKFTSYDYAREAVISHCEITVKTDTRRTYIIVKENETDQLFCKVMHL